MSASRRERREKHSEVDWQQPITIMSTDDKTIHPRSTGRNYANSVATPPCICGCPTAFHDMDSGECRSCGCEFVEAVKL